MSILKNTMKFIEKLFGRVNVPRPTDETKWIPEKIYRRIIVAKLMRKYYIPDQEAYKWLPETFTDSKGKTRTRQRIFIRKGTSGKEE